MPPNFCADIVLMESLPYSALLSEEDRGFLIHFVSRGTRPVRDVRRAHVVLLSDAGRSRREICKLLEVSPCTVDRVRQRWAREGVERAIVDRPRIGRPRALAPKDEAVVVALACTPAPEGAIRWSHRRLTDQLERQDLLPETVSRETVRRVLCRQEIKPWKGGLIGASPS